MMALLASAQGGLPAGGESGRASQLARTLYLLLYVERRTVDRL